MTPDKKQADDATGLLYYQMVCLFAVLLVFLVQLPRTALYLNLFTLAVGLLSVISRLRVGPPMFLLILSVTLVAQRLPAMRGFYAANAASHLGLDIFLAASVLIFLLAHCRLQALDQAILQVESRTKKTSGLSAKRAGSLVSTSEIVALVLTVPFWAIAAQVLWLTLPVDFTLAETLAQPLARVFPRSWGQDVGARFSRLFLLVWLAALALLVIRIGFRRWKLAHLSTLGAKLLLQDTLWRDTSSDQSTVARWLTETVVRKTRSTGKTPTSSEPEQENVEKRNKRPS